MRREPTPFGLMRRRKAWYYQHQPRPGVTVVGARLLELASDGSSVKARTPAGRSRPAR